MKRYIALLRGINISGKNKISMFELKKGFGGLGYAEVSTYLNSGNVIFSTDEDNEEVICKTVTSMIWERFQLDIPVFVILQKEIEDILSNAPDWWGNDNKDIYDNIIFLMPPLSYEEFYREMGQPKEELENVYHYRNAVFWSFSRKDYQKTNWWAKTANSGVNNRITIRTANTVRKIVEM